MKSGQSNKLSTLFLHNFSFIGLSYCANQYAYLQDIQLNFSGSNTDGCFTMAVSNSFLSSLEKSH